jgi:hypothetical protein
MDFKLHLYQGSIKFGSSTRNADLQLGFCEGMYDRGRRLI